MHHEYSSASEQSTLMQCTVNQSSSCYVKLAQGETRDGMIVVDKFQPIIHLPVAIGFRCARCNFADQRIDELARRHQKFQAGHCSGDEGDFEESRIQVVRIGGKHVGFGVREDLVASADGSHHLSEAEYQNARQIITSLDQARRSGIDSIESQLYQSLGWFRKTRDGTDFQDFGRDILQRVSQFSLPGTVYSRLASFFKQRISAVVECPADIRLLMSDEKKMTIRPITDQHNSYGKYFAEIIRIVFALVHLQVVNVASEDIFHRLQLAVPVLIEHEGEYGFEDVDNLWGILVNQEMSLIGNDLLKTAIRFKCFNPETGQLARSATVEQMAAKSFYFCRLYKLNVIMNSSADSLPTTARLVQEYFKTNDTPFHRLCYLKGLAGDIAGSEMVNPVISSSRHPSSFTVGGVAMSPSFLNILYLGLVEDFRLHLEQLLLGVEIDLDSFEIVDNHTDNRPGIGMRPADDSMECFLVGQLFRINGPIRSRFYGHPSSETVNVGQVDRYLSLFDQSCRVLCALIHVASGMPARATEMDQYRLVNGTSPRNIYFVDGQIMVVSRYNKTNSLTGRNNLILRFLPEVVSKMIAVWITMVRPLYGHFIGVLHGQARQSSAMKYCFVKSGNCISVQDVRECFEEATLKYPGRELKFSLYRHVVKHYVKNVLMIGARHLDLLDGEPELDGAEDAQFGHSSRTADAAYGRNESETICRDYVMKDFREMSGIWHNFLLTGGRRTMNDDEAVGQGGGQDIAALIRTNREVNLRTFREAQFVTSARDQRPSSPVEDARLSSFLKRDELVKTRILLETLTGFSEFKSHEQRLSIALSCFSQADCLSIIPTGGGKSLIFFLYASLIRRESGKTLVIVPTKSLQQQFCAKSGAFDLVGSSSLLDEQVADIFFLTPEAFSSNSCQSFIYRMILNGSLRRIFVDEAHQVISDAGFRVNFENLYSLKFLNVSLTFLTGTLSMSMAEELIAKFRRPERVFKTIRCSSNRSNQFLQVCKRGGMVELDQILERAFRDSMLVEGRLIVYVHSIAAIQRILDSSRFRASMTSYSSENTDSINIQSSQLWIAGTKKIMVATSGFGVGIDYSSVRMVVCFGMPYSIEDMVQQFGRGGRDGARSEAILLPLVNFDNSHCTENVRAYAETESICRRMFISELMDSCPVDCFASGGMEKCDICSASPTLLIRPPPQAPRRSSNGGVQSVNNSGNNYNNNYNNQQFIEKEPLTPIGRDIIATEADFEANLLRCLRQVQGKCLICLFERGEFRESCSCSLNTRCYSCLLTGHGTHSPVSLKCPDFKVKSNGRIHFKCGLKFSVCGGSSLTECPFAKIIPIFWRRRNYGKISTRSELDEAELKQVYVEFVQFVDDILVRKNIL